MIKKIKQPFTAVAVAVMLCFATVFAAAPEVSAASGTISGTVQCFYGNNQVVGVWVNAVNGTDGWANWSPNSSGGANYSYTLSQSSDYQLHVGCGGTPQNWGASMPSPLLSGNYYDLVCSWSISYGGYFCALS